MHHEELVHAGLFSLTDPSDLSDFLVLVSSHDSKAAAHHLEFRRGMSSSHGERVAMTQPRQVGMWVRLPNKGPFAVRKNFTVTQSAAVTHDLSILD